MYSPLLFDIVYVHVFLTPFSDFCDYDEMHIRGDNSVCEGPSGDNGARTGLVVGSWLLAVLVFLVWIMPIPLWSRGTFKVYVTLCIHTCTCKCTFSLSRARLPTHTNPIYI